MNDVVVVWFPKIQKSGLLYQVPPPFLVPGVGTYAWLFTGVWDVQILNDVSECSHDIIDPFIDN